MYCIIQGVRNILKRPDVAMCFEWSEKSILYLQQTYYHIVMVLRRVKMFFLFLKMGLRGAIVTYVSLDMY